MIIDEVLKLEKNNSSIRKIDLFLGCQVKYSIEYFKALCYKASILHHLGKNNDALKLLYEVVPNFNEISSEGIIEVCDGIIDLCIDLKRFDQVYKYIKIKQKYLPISKSVLHVKDNIKYYMALKQYDNAKEALEKYLDDDITKEEMIFAKIELANIYLILHEKQKYLDIIEDVENYYQTSLELEKLSDIGLNKLLISYDDRNYLKVISDGNRYLNDDSLDSHHKLKAASLLMNSYIINGDYKRAGIIEAEYNEFINENDLDDSIEFIKIAIDLYTKTHTLFQVKEYENKLDELESIKKQVKKENKKQKKQEEIFIPDVEEKEIIDDEDDDIRPNIFNITESIVKEEIEQKKNIISVNNVSISTNYEKLEAVFNTINDCDMSLKFREIFRNMSITLSKLYDIKEIYILYYKRAYFGFHYKAERVYDKNLEYEDLEDTINLASISYDSEVFLDKENNRFNKNIVTGKPYEDDIYAISIPLKDDLKTIGSIAFYSDKDFLEEELVYESLKLISSMLNTRLVVSLYQDDVIYQNKRLFFINDNFNRGFKEQIDGYIHLNTVGTNILGIEADVRLDDYYLRMKSSDVAKYKNLLNNIYNLNLQNEVLEYDFKKDNTYLRIRETFFLMYNEGVCSLLSILEDITEDEKNKEDLIKLAYTDPVSKLDTLVKLNVDLNDIYQTNILALAIVDIIDFDLYRTLYGYNFTNQLIYAVGKEFVNYYSNIFTFSVYHLEIDRYAILFRNINDKRLIDSNLKKAFVHVRNELFKLNSRVNLKFNAGVYRLGKNANLEDSSIIIYNAFDALDDAKDIKTLDDHICHFDGLNHKNRFKENSLVTHISESLDHGNMSICYQQVVNLSDNSVFGYFAKANLDNYEADYDVIYNVAKRKNIITTLEKYAVSNAIKELKMLKDETKGYIFIFLEVGEETLKENFLSFIRAQNNFFKISPKLICLNVSDANNEVVKSLRSDGYKISSSNIVDLYNDDIDVFFLDSNKISLEAISEVKDLCEKKNVTCIISNIDDKNDVLVARKENIELIYGKYFKKLIRMKDIIARNKV